MSRRDERRPRAWRTFLALRALIAVLSIAPVAHASAPGTDMLSEIAGPLVLVAGTGAAATFGALDVAYWADDEHLPRGLAITQVASSVPLAVIGGAISWGRSDTMRPFGYFILGASPLLFVTGLIELELGRSSKDNARRSSEASFALLPIPGGVTSLWTMKLP
jgi:hypothetical protein